MAVCLKLRSMNKNIRAQMAAKYLVCVMLIAGAAACDKEGFSYDNVTENTGTSYDVLDTLTIHMSTAYVDSIPTSDQEVALVGTNIDPVFGTISSSSYWRVRAFTGTPPALTAVYDSTVLMIHPKLYAYGDTLKPQEVEVYRVTQEIKKPVTGQYFYSYDQFATESTPLGTKYMSRIRPHLDSVFKIRIDDALGTDLYNKIVRKNATVVNQDQFTRYLYGLAIKPGANSQVITPLRADDSLNLRLYYHTNGTDQTQTYVDLPLYDNASQFNHVDFTRPAGSPLANLTPDYRTSTNKLYAEDANQQTYVQPLTHLITRLDIPSLRGYGVYDKYFKVMQATLTVRPERTTYFYPYQLPPRLTLVELNAGNAVTDSITSPSTGAVQTGNLYTDYVYNLGTTYTYDVTRYVVSQMSATDATSRALGLTIPGQTGLQNFQRVILGGPKNTTNRLTLKIYYLRYN